MDWHEQRREWNAEGQCAREACRGDITETPYWNRSTRLLYCESCADLINRYNSDADPPLCSLVEGTIHQIQR